MAPLSRNRLDRRQGRLRTVTGECCGRNIGDIQAAASELSLWQWVYASFTRAPAEYCLSHRTHRESVRRSPSCGIAHLSDEHHHRER